MLPVNMKVAAGVKKKDLILQELVKEIFVMKMVF
jgi:hypothetical protein